MASFLSGASDWWNGGGKNFAANALNDLGFGLTQSTTGLGGALGAATAYSEQQQPARDLQAEKIAAQKQQAQQLQTAIANLRDKYQRPDLADAVSQGYDVNKAWQDVLTKKAPPAMSTDIQNYEYAQTHPGFADYQTQKGGSSELSLTPTWGIDQDKNSPTYGKQVIGQLGKDGKFHRTEMSGIQPIDPATMQGNKTTSTVDAKTAAAARAALPGAQQAFDLATKAADSLLNDTEGMADQFGNTLGVPHQMVPDWATLPGTPMARFRTELAQGQGNAFLQARQVLKGAGQVTDYEGAKAEAAYSRMQLAAQKNNQDEFIGAVRDFKDAVNEGYQKIQAAANGDYAQGGPGVTGNQPAQTSTGVQWSYSP